MFYRVFNSCQGISDYVNCPIPHILLYTTGISSVKKTKKLQKDQRKKHCLSVFTKKIMICDLQYTFILKHTNQSIIKDTNGILWPSVVKKPPPRPTSQGWWGHLHVYCAEHIYQVQMINRTDCEPLLVRIIFSSFKLQFG